MAPDTLTGSREPKSAQQSRPRIFTANGTKMESSFTQELRTNPRKRVTWLVYPDSTPPVASTSTGDAGEKVGNAIADLEKREWLTDKRSLSIEASRKAFQDRARVCRQQQVAVDQVLEGLVDDTKDEMEPEERGDQVAQDVRDPTTSTPVSDPYKIDGRLLDRLCEVGDTPSSADYATMQHAWNDPTVVMQLSDHSTWEIDTDTQEKVEKIDLYGLLAHSMTPQDADIILGGESNDKPQQSRKCVVLDTPMRLWQERQKELNAEAFPLPHLSATILKWEGNFEVLVDSGASRDFVNEATVKLKGWKTMPATTPITVEVADGRTQHLDRVAAVEIQMAPGLIYRTLAYVMPMGGALDVILGMTWWATFEMVRFYGQAEPKRLEVEVDGKTFIMEAKARRRQKREMIKSINAEWKAKLGEDHIEIISPQEGARDMLLNDMTESAARREHHADFEKAYLYRLAVQDSTEEGWCDGVIRSTDTLPGWTDTPPKEPDDKPPDGAHANWKQDAYVRARPKTKGRFIVELEPLTSALRAHGMRDLQLRVDVGTSSSNNKPRVYLINAEERDDLYPFGKQPVTQANAVAKPAPPVTEISPELQRLVGEIVRGEHKPGQKLDVERHGLKPVIAEARAKKVRLQDLRSQMDNLAQRNRTLGKEFWTVDMRERLTETLRMEYDDVIREELKEAKELNRKLEPAYIRLREDWNGTPPFERSRRMSPLGAEVCRQQLQELLEKGMIEPSSSPFGAAVMIIPKPGKPGRYRMVIDYRKLNALTTADRYPLPDIQEILSDVGARDYQYWCTFDLASGFYNVPIYEPHRERTAMVTPFGAYQWKVMSMGLKNAPSVFQRNVQKIFHDMPEVRIFVDDGIVGGRTVEEAYMNMRKVLERLRQFNMVVRTSKMQLFRRTLNFLGHVISGDGVSPQQDKVEAVRNWPVPKNKKDLRGFLGLANYYAAYIYNAAEKMRPLQKLTKDAASVPATVEEWLQHPELLHAFNTVKYSLTQAPVLVIPDFQGALDGSKPFRVQTDASEAAMGAVLMQNQGKGWQPVSFASKAFKDAEFNYTVTEKELKALVWATCEKFRHYLLGTTYELQGDHKPLMTLLTPGREVNARQARWIEMLQENNVPQMEYVPGITLAVPDALSRRPDYMELIPTAKETLEKFLAQQGVEAVDRPGATAKPFAELDTRHSMPQAEQLLPPILEGTPRALTTEEEFPKLAARETEESPLPTPQVLTGTTDVTGEGGVSASTVAEDGSTLEGGGEFGNSPPDMISSRAEGGGKTGILPPNECFMNIWRIPDERKPDILAIDHGLAWMTRDCESAEMAELWGTIGEMAHGVLRPKDTAVAPPREKKAATPLWKRDNQDWQVHPQEFERWHKFFQFTVDACSDKQGKNAQLKRYWSREVSCLRRSWDGERVWCNPPFTDPDMKISDILRHFQECRRRDPRTAACFVLPYFPGAEWERELLAIEDMQCVFTYPKGTRLFFSPEGGNPRTNWDVQIWWCGPQQETGGDWAKPVQLRPRAPKTVTAATDQYRKTRQEKLTVQRDGPDGQPLLTEGATVPRLRRFLTELTQAQRRDPYCQKQQQLLQEQGGGIRRFRMVAGLLWHIAEGRYQIVVPDQPPLLRELALRECHDAPFSGHLGVSKTLARLRTRFWWPKMVEDV
jgi:hypothetical protein